MNRMTVILTAALILTASAVTAQDAPDETALRDRHEEFLLAQGPNDTGRPGGPGRFGGPRMGRGKMAEQRKHLEQFRMFEMLKYLDLSDDQEVEFLTAFKKMRDQERELEERRRAALESLAQALETQPLDGALLNKRIDELTEIKQTQEAAHLEHFGNLRNILTTEQAAKFVLFHERFEYELLKRLREFHGRGDDGQP